MAVHKEVYFVSNGGLDGSDTVQTCFCLIGKTRFVKWRSTLVKWRALDITKALFGSTCRHSCERCG